MEKILIGEKAYIGKQNTDIFIDVELKSEIETLKRDNLDNIFDFQNQYILERNNSLAFCVYGKIESRFGNCESLSMTFTIGDTVSGATSSPDIIYTPYNFSGGTSGHSVVTLSKPLSKTNDLSKNIYGASKASYFLLFELNKELLTTQFDNKLRNKSIFVKIYNPVKELYGEFTIPFLYFTSEGEPIEFGTESAIVDENDNIIEINNNFSFFYNKHWIKQDLEVHGPLTVQFTNSELLVSEIDGTATIDIELSEPSIYGTESARIVVDYGIDRNGIRQTTSILGLDFNFNDLIFTWNIGEKTKTFDVQLINDLLVENDIEVVRFRIIPLTNVRIIPDSNYSFTLRISSDDQPVQANFIQGSQTVIEPRFNDIIDVPIQVQLSSPVTISNQSIKVRINQAATTMSIGHDLFLNNLNSTDIDLGFPVSTDSASFTIQIKGNNKYDLDRKVVLELVQNSPNIIPGTQSTGSTNSQSTIIVKDGTAPYYTQFTIPVNLARGQGLYKQIYNNQQFVKPFIIALQTNQPDVSKNYTRDQLDVTHLFNVDWVIENQGSPIVWNNQIINSGDKFTIPINVSAVTSDIVLNLPANSYFNSSTNGYYYTKYNMYFNNLSTIIPTNTPSNQIENVKAFNTYKSPIYQDNNLNVVIAGLSGSNITKRYMVTDLKNVRTQYNEVNDSCSFSATNINQLIRFNGVIFMPRFISNSNPISASKIYFSPKQIINKCTKPTTGSSLSVGLEYAPNPPFNEKYIVLNIGKIWIQSGYDPSFRQEKMYLGTIPSNSPVPYPNKYFFDWNNVNSNTVLTANLIIANKGLRAVYINGQIIEPSDEVVIPARSLNLNSLSLTLPTNQDYVQATNSFTTVDYEISFKNISVTRPNSNTIDEVIDYSFKVENITGNTMQYMQAYNVENQYNNVMLPAPIGSPQVICSRDIVGFSNYFPHNVTVNGFLFYKNTGSQFVRTVFRRSSIIPTCNISPIPYHVII